MASGAAAATTEPAAALADAASARLKARGPVPPPTPAYLPTAGSPLTVDERLYADIQSAPRRLVQAFTLPIRSGQAWKAPAGSIVRISTPEGPQVGQYIIITYSRGVDFRTSVQFPSFLLSRLFIFSFFLSFFLVPFFWYGGSLYTGYS